VLLRDAFRVLCSRQTHSQVPGLRSFLRVGIGEALFPFSFCCLGPKQFSLFMRTTAEACHLVATPPLIPKHQPTLVLLAPAWGIGEICAKKLRGRWRGQPLAGLTHPMGLAWQGVKRRRDFLFVF
jgi:hypothetical protein